MFYAGYWNCLRLSSDDWRLERNVILKLPQVEYWWLNVGGRKMILKESRWRWNICIDELVKWYRKSGVRSDFQNIMGFIHEMIWFWNDLVQIKCIPCTNCYMKNFVIRNKIGSESNRSYQLVLQRKLGKTLILIEV